MLNVSKMLGYERVSVIARLIASNYLWRMDE